MKKYIRLIGIERIGTVDSDNLIALTAPIDGRIVERTTTLGEVVTHGNVMYRVADTWATVKRAKNGRLWM